MASKTADAAATKQPDPDSDIADLERDLSSLIVAIDERSRLVTARNPAPADDRASLAADPDAGFSDIWAAFAELRNVLGLPPQSDWQDSPRRQASAPEPDLLGSRQLAGAVAEARAYASWYRETPEWQRITRLGDAAHALMTAIREVGASCWAEIRQDIQVRGLARTLTARASLAVSGAAYLLAAKLERSGQKDSRAWRAARELHRSATGTADRVMRYLPQDRMNDVQHIIDGLRQAPPAPWPDSSRQMNGSPAHEDPGPRSPAALARSGYPGGLQYGATPQGSCAPPAPAATPGQQPSHARR
jgi:hypothetical protein